MATSMLRRLVSCARMPWSIASCTSRSPTTGPHAAPTETSESTARAPSFPRRYLPSRVRPVLGRDNFVSEQACERSVALEQLARLAVLDDHAVVEDDRAIGRLDGREALRRDEDATAGDGGAGVLDQQ